MSLISSKARKYDIKVDAMTLVLCLALAKCQHCHSLDSTPVEIVLIKKFLSSSFL